MTKEQWLNRHRHEFYGLMLESVWAGKARTGGELNLWLELAQAKILARMNVMFDDLIPPFPTTPDVGNGTKLPPAQGTTNNGRQSESAGEAGKPAAGPTRGR